MRHATFLLLALLLLAPSARAEGVYATIETESWTETWTGSEGFLYYPQSTPFTVRLLAGKDLDPFEGFVFDFLGSGNVTLESLSLYGGVQNEGDFVDTQDGWVQEVRVTDLGECLDCTGEPTAFAQFPVHACINYPDPVEQPTIGELKALYEH